MSFMAKASLSTPVPIATLPMQVSGRNYLWRRVLTESIR